MTAKNEHVSTDPLKQARLMKEDERIRMRNISDLRTLLKLVEFRRFVWILWTKTGIFRTPFSTNALEMGRGCGIQMVGQELLADVNDADVNAFAQIQREYISEQKSKEAAEKKEEEKQNG